MASHALAQPRLAAIPTLPAHPPRRLLENAIQSMIDLLDAMDGDADLEDEEPEGDIIEELGEGPEWSTFVPPLYGVDQEKGPRNYDEVIEFHLQKELEEARAHPKPLRWRSL